MTKSEIKNNIDFDKVRFIASEYITDKYELESFISNFNNNILLNANSLDKTINKFFLISNEIYPFSTLESSENVENGIIEEYLNGTLKKKNIFLTDYNIKVFSGVIKNPYKEHFISYKDNNNLNDEVERIFNFVDGEKILQNFLESINDKGNINLFLNINSVLPEMLSTKKIFLYSALLNYTYSEIDRTVFFKQYLKTFLKDNKIPVNWDKIRVIFKDFLKELKERTINY